MNFYFWMKHRSCLLTSRYDPLYLMKFHTPFLYHDHAIVRIFFIGIRTPLPFPCVVTGNSVAVMVCLRRFRRHRLFIFRRFDQLLRTPRRDRYKKYTCVDLRPENKNPPYYPPQHAFFQLATRLLRTAFLPAGRNSSVFSSGGKKYSTARKERVRTVEKNVHNRF